MTAEDYDPEETFGHPFRTEAERRKFEADKAIKEEDKPHPYCPWGPRISTHLKWLQPVIITSSSSSGSLTSPEKVQELGGLTSVPEVKSTTRATDGLSEPEEPKEADKMNYCDVTLGQIIRIAECTEGGDPVD